MNHANVGRREDATTATQYADGSTAKRLALLRQQARENGGEYANSARTTGWAPTCACDVGNHEWTLAGGAVCAKCQRAKFVAESLPCRYEPIPCTVLDPFGGSGTTAAVAVSLGRRAILIELNASYIELAHARVGDTPRPLR